MPSEPPLARPADGFERAVRLSNQTDGLIRMASASLADTGSTWALLALGSYGRQELCPFSDLDLLLLIDSRLRQAPVNRLIQRLIYPLWDQGKEASHSVRTPRQTISAADSDFKLRTALCDARLITGSQKLFSRLTAGLNKKPTVRQARAILAKTAEADLERYRTWGDASYSLEPNLKESRGGLRDHHSIFWLARLLFGIENGADLGARGLLTATDLQKLRIAADTLLGLRFDLHVITGRRTDRLHHEDLQALRRSRQTSGSAAAETELMRILHQSALTVREIYEAFRAAAELQVSPAPRHRTTSIGAGLVVRDGRIGFAGAEIPAPAVLLKLFTVIAEQGLPLHPEARRLIQQRLPGLGQRLDTSAVNPGIRAILTASHPARALTSMLETGVLETIIPDFASIKGLNRFDPGHSHTVDKHSIRTVQLLHDSRTEFAAIFEPIGNPEILMLAALLHDIGKGEAGNHCESGAAKGRRIALQLGFSPEDAATVAFLIRHHLLLPRTALRRDLSEEKTTLDLAAAIRDPAHLAMLYLLTVADSRATGPESWNAWKASLTGELYAKVMHALNHGIFRDTAGMMQLDRKWQHLLERQQDRGRLWILPQAYILAFDVKEIRAHLDRALNVSGPDDLDVKAATADGQATVSIIARERPGLFALLTGILASVHLDIISARIFTWHDGTAVDVFKVTLPWENYDQWDRIAARFRDITAGRSDIAALVGTAGLYGRTPAPRNATEMSIVIDNETSDFFTVVEITAPDRPGLLHAIAGVLAVAGLNIHRAFINSVAHRAVDVFYLVDAAGQKITGKADRIALRKRIKEIL